MKHQSFPITSLLLFSLLLLACGKDDDAVEEPTCPTCWDEKMRCVAGNCECPEGAIEIGQPNLEWHSEAYVPPSERKLCVMPDTLTFIARFPRFECFDTFAVTFPYEPLEFDTPPHFPTGTPTVEYSRSQGNYSGFSRAFYSEKTPAGVFVFFSNIPSSHGHLWISPGCWDFDEDFNTLGSGYADFQGYFVHKDTIAGDLVFVGSGTLQHLVNHRMPIQLVRTVPF